MSLKRKKLRLVCGSPAIEGRGETLVFKVSGHRETKTGAFEYYDLELEACRHSIRQLADQIAKMQQRDRERLQWEFDRLKSEVKPLTET
jgi:hypothetical protein